MATTTVAAPAAEAAPAPGARPTRPDEKIFKEELAKAEKEHKASMDKFVCVAWLFFFLLPNAWSCYRSRGSCMATLLYKRSFRLCHQAIYSLSYYEAGDWHIKIYYKDEKRRVLVEKEE